MFDRGSTHLRPRVSYRAPGRPSPPFGEGDAESESAFVSTPSPLPRAPPKPDGRQWLQLGEVCDRSLRGTTLAWCVVVRLAREVRRGSSESVRTPLPRLPPALDRDPPRPQQRTSHSRGRNTRAGASSSARSSDSWIGVARRRSTSSSSSSSSSSHSASRPPSSRTSLPCSLLVSTQRIEVWETDDLGRCLVVGGVLRFAERDESAQHEMFAHVPLFAHKDPKDVRALRESGRACLCAEGCATWSVGMTGPSLSVAFGRRRSRSSGAGWAASCGRR